jgi:hypothetical protein
MATLLSQAWVGGRLERTWSHIGDDGRKKVTTEVVQDCEPAIENAKLLAQNQNRNSLLRFKANVPGTSVEHACRIQAKLWGVKFHECFREVMQNKTDRAQRVWRMLTEGSDYSKLQARHWR